MNKKWLWLILIIPVVLILGFIGYVVVGSNRNAPMPQAELALQSDANVMVITEPWYAFTPTNDNLTTGFILYPGGLVPAEAYAPTARAIADAGYFVVLPSMPLNLAVFAPNTATDIIANYPDIENWVIGGHSLGGAMAATFVDNNPNSVEGLALWAAYPAESNDISGLSLTTTSIFGSNDGVATVADVKTAVLLLPPSTTYFEIEGGNHTYFGWYGDGLQAGDNPATISREEQQAQVVEQTVKLLEGFDN